MTRRFFIALLVVVLGIALQIIVGSATGTWINFALAALIATAFFVTITELVALALFSIFVLSWQPVFSFEMLMFGLLPFVVFFTHRKIHLKPWMANAVSILVAVLVLNLVFGTRLLIADPQIFLWDVLVGEVFGGMVFLGLKD